MNKASAGKPERKISETILDFGEPLLSEAITEETPIAMVREIYKLVVLVWNAHVAATPRWADPAYLQMLQQIAASLQMPSEARAWIEKLSRRWQEKFSDAKYCVGHWHVKIKDDDTPELLLRRPANTAALVRRRAHDPLDCNHVAIADHAPRRYRSFREIRGTRYYEDSRADTPT